MSLSELEKLLNCHNQLPFIPGYSFMIHFFKGLVLLGLFYPYQMHAQDSKTASVVVKVTGIKSREGLIQAALFSSKTSFPDQKPFKAYTHTLKKEVGQVEVNFKEVPFGEYAVAVYHDQNGNNKLDTNFMGIPKEPYGFSNNHHPKLSAPDYEAAKVEINQPGKTLEVHIDQL
jgi:uncharacterized protein (DUF2141 family)